MFETVMWATDGSAPADEALALARSLAEESGGRLIAAHCIEMTLPGKGGGSLTVHANEDDLSAKVRTQVLDLTDAGITTSLRTVRVPVGEGARALAELAREEGADVIVTGSRGHTMLGGLATSLTQRLLHVAPCPVLVVPVTVTAER